jgi:hypothetical protein
MFARKKRGDTADVSGRVAAEEKSRFGRQAVTPVLVFAEKLRDGQIVAEYADAALGGLHARGEFRRRVVAFADGREDVEFDGGFQGRGLLIGRERLKNSLGCRRRGECGGFVDCRLVHLICSASL